VQPDRVPGGYSEGETPGPIPNPEVKPLSADGTAREASRESRTPPEHTSRKRAGPTGPALFLIYGVKVITPRRTSLFGGDSRAHAALLSRCAGLGVPSGIFSVVDADLFEQGAVGRFRSLAARRELTRAAHDE
jgi:hypothetical protein